MARRHPQGFIDPCITTLATKPPVGPQWIHEATIDGEAVVCDAAGVADFERLHSRGHDRQAFLYAFDLLELDGLDLRPLPLEQRKDQLRKLLFGCARGIQFSEHLEDAGATVFAHACRLGCEGIVSKDRSRP